MPLASPVTALRLAGPAALAAVAIALAGCAVVGTVGQRTWGLATTNEAGQAQTITVNDTSGLVTDVEFDPADADLFGGVTVPAGAEPGLDVAWTEGACDEATTIGIARRGAGLAVTVTVEAGGEGCDGFGIPRAIRLRLTQPVDPAVVSVTQ